MPELPIYPDPGREAPGYELERRRKAVAAQPDEVLENAYRALRVECVHETLRLTGAPLSREVVVRVAEGRAGENEEEERLVRGALQALEILEREAKRRPEPDLALVQEVHRAANPASEGELRTTDRPPQFAGARRSEPRFIQSKLENLLGWLAAESCRSMFPAERIALWFARFQEIAPFERGNFRTGHLFASFFARNAGYPPVTLKLEDAEPIRTEIERAVRFDTLPLVERFSDAISRSLSVVEDASGLGGAQGPESPKES